MWVAALGLVVVAAVALGVGLAADRPLRPVLVAVVSSLGALALLAIGVGRRVRPSGR